MGNELCLFVGSCGVLLLLCTLLALVLFMLGLREEDAEDGEILKWKIFGRVKLTSRKMISLLVISVSIVVMGSFLTSCDGEYAKLITQRDRLTMVPEQAGSGHYVIDEEISVLDLREIRDLNLPDWYMHKLSPADWSFHRVLGKVDKGVAQIAFRHATSFVLGIDPLEMPKGSEWVGVLDSAERIRNPFLSILDTSFFRHLVERKGRMSTFLAKVPVVQSEGQIIDYRLRYYNSFQGREEEWVGKIFDADTREFILNIQFPSDKPFKRWEVVKRAPGAEEAKPDSSTSVTGQDGHTLLRWVVKDAKRGEKFFLKWTW